MSASMTVTEHLKGEAPPTTGDRAFWVKCEPCGHIWAAAYWPMEVALFAKIAKRGSICPKCGETKRVYVAKQADGKLLEGEAA